MTDNICANAIFSTNGPHTSCPYAGTEMLYRLASNRPSVFPSHCLLSTIVLGPDSLLMMWNWRWGTDYTVSFHPLSNCLIVVFSFGNFRSHDWIASWKWKISRIVGNQNPIHVCADAERDGTRENERIHFICVNKNEHEHTYFFWNWLVVCSWSKSKSLISVPFFENEIFCSSVAVWKNGSSFVLLWHCWHGRATVGMK